MKETGQIKPEDKENFMNQESQTPLARDVRYRKISEEIRGEI